jgi:transcriptional regulator GlxA family with amidase domain
MVKRAKPRIATVGVFGFDGCSAWITAGLLELFDIANNAMSHLPQSRGVKPVRFGCHVVSNKRRLVNGSHGVRFSPELPRRRYDVMIVPPIWCTSLEDLEQRASTLQALRPALVQMSRRTMILASTCSGSVLLAGSGLLFRRRATTCWWLVDWFRRAFPDIDLQPDKLVVKDGDRWTAAAGSAYIHLGLELVSELAGDTAAAATSKLMLVERRRGSQSPFLPQVSCTSDDAHIEQAMRYLEQHSHANVSIRELCRAIDVSHRSLARKFQNALGMSALSYLQSIRIARAKQLLERTLLPFDRIVEQCGYEDISSFRKLFSRHVGMTPKEYRLRFRN